MEMAGKWNGHDIVVDEDTVAFVEVPSNLKQFFHDGALQAISLDVVLVFLRPGPSVYDTVGHKSHTTPKILFPNSAGACWANTA
jgi:hypothetical protein